MRHIVPFALSAFVCPTVATAELELWSGTMADVTIVGNTAEITAAGTFKFQSIDGNGDPNMIDAITIANGVTGTVTVYIERDSDDDSPGALHIGAIDLTNTSGVTGNLAELRITGRMGEGAMVGSVVTAVAGEIDVGLGLIKNFDASAGGTSGNVRFGGNVISTVELALGNMTGSLEIGGLLDGDVTLGTMSGDIEVAGNFTGNCVVTIGAMTGNILLSANAAGQLSASSLDGNITMTAGGVNSFSGMIAIDSSYDGTITTVSGGGGDITIGGDLETGAAIN